MVGSSRYKSTAAGDNDTGHIEAGKNEGIFFVDSEYSSISAGTLGLFLYDLA